jgi:hypothetical protein
MFLKCSKEFPLTLQKKSNERYARRLTNRFKTLIFEFVLKFKAFQWEFSKKFHKRCLENYNRLRKRTTARFRPFPYVAPEQSERRIEYI